jgi:site-specific DNA recombinase
VKCDDCGQPFTGYIVKAKNLYYYKCRTNGCKCNRSADKMHKLFTHLLESYAVKKDMIAPLQYQLEYIFKAQNKEDVEQEKILKLQAIDIQKKIDSIEESYFIKKDMPRETYDKFFAKYESEKVNIAKQLAKCNGNVSNFEKYIDNALTLSTKLPQVWISSPIAVREKLQKLIFPDGIYYNKEKMAFRTEKVNSIFEAIASAESITGGNEKGTKHTCDDLSPKAES